MINILEYVDSKEFSTINIGGKFRYFTIISSIEELISFYDIAQNDGQFKDIPMFVLGGGSNIIFSEGVLDVIALKNEIKGFEIINENNDFIDIKVGSGEIWDNVVEKTVEMGLSGFEPMSFIPGTVGAIPVQNVGAYGTEAKDVVLGVEVFNTKDGSLDVILNKDCNFSYRNSIFKGEYKGKYFITHVTFRLSKSYPKVPNYPSVLDYFESKKKLNPTLSDIRNAIISIRKEKLPDPKEIPNVGSFFKNPIIPIDKLDSIKFKFPEVKFFEVGKNLFKIPAGWLIENVGLKGKSFGNIYIYDKNALVLINKGGATKSDLIYAKTKIVEKVNNIFGIILEEEPEMI